MFAANSPDRARATKRAAIESAAKTVANEVGDAGLEGVVANAGIGIGGPWEFVDLDEVRRQLEVNVIGVLAVVQAFHDKHDFKNTGGEELTYRIALMAEELGEISACVSKGKDRHKLAEECADLFILLIGTAIAAEFDLAEPIHDVCVHCLNH